MNCFRLSEANRLNSAARVAARGITAGKISFAVLFAAAAISAPRGASAAVMTFAQFQEATGGSNSNAFVYLDNGATADAQLDSNPGDPGTPIPVTFTYLNQSGLPADLQGPQNATLTLTSSTTSSAESIVVFNLQAIDGSGSLPDVLTITRDTPAAEGNGSRTNLLTMDFTGDILGITGSNTPQLLGSTTGAIPGTISYTSDFLSFATSQQRDYSLTFSSWLSSADGNGLEDSASDSYFASATAAGVGTFDSDEVTTVIVPEPATLAMTALLAPMLLWRRKRSA